MPAITPMGNANTILPATRYKVPTMAGKIPPLVIPSSGMAVRNSQEITLNPLTKIKDRIANKIKTTEKLSILKRVKAILCLMYFILSTDIIF